MLRNPCDVLNIPGGHILNVLTPPLVREKFKIYFQDGIQLPYDITGYSDRIYIVAIYWMSWHHNLNKIVSSKQLTGRHEIQLKIQIEPLRRHSHYSMIHSLYFSELRLGISCELSASRQFT